MSCFDSPIFAKKHKFMFFVRSIWCVMLIVTIVAVAVDVGIFKSEGRYSIHYHKIANMNSDRNTQIENFNVNVKNGLLAIGFDFSYSPLLDCSVIVSVFDKGQITAANGMKGAANSTTKRRFVSLLKKSNITADSIHITLNTYVQNPKDSYYGMIITTESPTYQNRMLVFNLTFFVADIVFFFYFVRLRTSTFRVIGGFVLTIYSMLANEPFTVFSNSKTVMLFKQVVLICFVSLGLFYAAIVKGKSSKFDYLVFGLLSLIYFITITVSYFRILGNTSGFVFKNVETNNFMIISIIALFVYVAVSYIIRFMRDSDPRNIALLTSMVFAAIFLELDSMGESISTFYVLTLCLTQLFTFQFPSQMRLRKKKARIQPAQMVAVETSNKLSGSSDSDYESTEYESDSYDSDYYDYNDYDDDDDDYSSSSDDRLVKVKSKKGLPLKKVALPIKKAPPPKKKAQPPKKKAPPSKKKAYARRIPDSSDDDGYDDSDTYYSD